MKLDLTVIKQIITEITGIDGNLFRVGTRFLESGKVYLSYQIEEENNLSKSYKFCLEIKEGKLKFRSYIYDEKSFLNQKNIEHNQQESLIIKRSLCGLTKIDKKEGGDFITSLNEKIN